MQFLKKMTFSSKSKAKPSKHVISLKRPHLTPCLESSHLTGPTEMNFRVTRASGNALSFFIAQLWYFRKPNPSQIPLLAPASIPCLPGPLGLPLPSDPCCSSFLLFLRLSPFSNGNPSLEDSICHHYLDVKKKKNTVALSSPIIISPWLVMFCCSSILLWVFHLSTKWHSRRNQLWIFKFNVNSMLIASILYYYS